MAVITRVTCVCICMKDFVFYFNKWVGIISSMAITVQPLLYSLCRGYGSFLQFRSAADMVHRACMVGDC